MSKIEIKVSFKPYDAYSKNSIASIGMKQGLDLTLSSTKSWKGVLNHLKSKWSKLENINERLQLYFVHKIATASEDKSSCGEQLPAKINEKDKSTAWDILKRHPTSVEFLQKHGGSASEGFPVLPIYYIILPPLTHPNVNLPIPNNPANIPISSQVPVGDKTNHTSNNQFHFPRDAMPSILFAEDSMARVIDEIGQLSNINRDLYQAVSDISLPKSNVATSVVIPSSSSMANNTNYNTTVASFPKPVTLSSLSYPIESDNDFQYPYHPHHTMLEKLPPVENTLQNALKLFAGSEHTKMEFPYLPGSGGGSDENPMLHTPGSGDLSDFGTYLPPHDTYMSHLLKVVDAEYVSPEQPPQQQYNLVIDQIAVQTMVPNNNNQQQQQQPQPQLLAVKKKKQVIAKSSKNNMEKGILGKVKEESKGTVITIPSVKEVKTEVMSVVQQHGIRAPTVLDFAVPPPPVASSVGLLSLANPNPTPSQAVMTTNPSFTIFPIPTTTQQPPAPVAQQQPLLPPVPLPNNDSFSQNRSMSNCSIARAAVMAAASTTTNAPSLFGAVMQNNSLEYWSSHDEYSNSRQSAKTDRSSPLVGPDFIGTKRKHPDNSSNNNSEYLLSSPSSVVVPMSDHEKDLLERKRNNKTNMDVNNIVVPPPPSSPIRTKKNSEEGMFPAEAYQSPTNDKKRARKHTNNHHQHHSQENTKNNASQEQIATQQFVNQILSGKISSTMSPIGQKQRQKAIVTKATAQELLQNDHKNNQNNSIVGDNKQIALVASSSSASVVAIAGATTAPIIAILPGNIIPEANALLLKQKLQQQQKEAATATATTTGGDSNSRVDTVSSSMQHLSRKGRSHPEFRRIIPTLIAPLPLEPSPLNTPQR